MRIRNDFLYYILWLSITLSPNGISKIFYFTKQLNGKINVSLRYQYSDKA